MTHGEMLKLLLKYRKSTEDDSVKLSDAEKQQVRKLLMSDSDTKEKMSHD